MQDIVRDLGYLCLGTRMKRIAERLQADVQTLISQQGLDVQASQFPLMAALDHAAPLTIAQLVETLGVSQPAVTRSVKQLAAADLVRIEEDPLDGRVRKISLSRRGSNLLGKAKVTLWPPIEQSLKEACPSRRGDLLQHLDRLEDALSQQSLVSRVASTSGGKRRE